MPPIYSEIKDINGGLAFARILTREGVARVKKQIANELADADLSASNILPLIQQIRKVSELDIFSDFSPHDKLLNLVSIFKAMIKVLPRETGDRKYTENNIHDLIVYILEKRQTPEEALNTIHTKMDKRCVIL